jgi:RNA polymerase sigma-70 factor (ECF subfamily)
MSTLDSSRLPAHLNRLQRAALALCSGRSHDADDLVQDVYVKVLAKPRTLTGDDEAGYLLRVLRNTFISQRRSAARRPATATAPEDFDRFASGAPGPQRALETRQLFGHIAGLPGHQRDVVVAVDLLGLSYKEAAQSLDVPAGTVMSRLFRARRALAGA